MQIQWTMAYICITRNFYRIYSGLFNKSVKNDSIAYKPTFLKALNQTIYEFKILLAPRNG